MEPEEYWKLEEEGRCFHCYEKIKEPYEENYCSKKCYQEGNMPIYPSEGDTCGCGGTIQYIGNREWEQGYYCVECGREWWYD